MELKTAIVIEATPEKVWEVLVDFESYPSWNPFVKSLTGVVKTGNQIEVQLQQMKFKPTVMSFDEAREFSWLGHLWVRGLFDGKHSFQLQSNNDGTTTFVHSEVFRGLLVSLLKKKLVTETKAGFEEMNNALKKKVESGR